MISLTAD